jgi:hypothetical protein
MVLHSILTQPYLQFYQVWKFQTFLYARLVVIIILGCAGVVEEEWGGGARVGGPQAAWIHLTL